MRVLVDVSPLTLIRIEQCRREALTQKIKQHQNLPKTKYIMLRFFCSLSLFFSFYYFCCYLVFRDSTPRLPNVYAQKHSISDSFHRHSINSFLSFFSAPRLPNSWLYSSYKSNEWQTFGMLSSGVHVITICYSMQIDFRWSSIIWNGYKTRVTNHTLVFFPSRKKNTKYATQFIGFTRWLFHFEVEKKWFDIEKKIICKF